MVLVAVGDEVLRTVTAQPTQDTDVGVHVSPLVSHQTEVPGEPEAAQSEAAHEHLLRPGLLPHGRSLVQSLQRLQPPRLLRSELGTVRVVSPAMASQQAQSGESLVTASALVLPLSLLLHRFITDSGLLYPPLPRRLAHNLSCCKDSFCPPRMTFSIS